ncbi:hypothetical protein [Demequina sp. NBRC 110055]|uniref:hypothetical protein n=1 Tax=Demequina sp. NBRC 110055 TaxID=1570344 RepID=UPI001F32E812|nr:hypothetical protein [Demequina sp. NBRC 110055]
MHDPQGLPAPRRTLLVGCGKLGLRLAERLRREGREVVALRRDISGLPASVNPIAADLRAPVERALPEVDAMVITLPPSVDPDGYPAVLERLRAALPANPARTIFVSSTGVFEGWEGPQPIMEVAVPQPHSERAVRIRQGELAAIDLFGAVVVRPAGIYGPGRDFLVRTVRDGRPITAGTRTNRIHETDLVRALHALLVDERPPAVLHAVDAAPAPLGDVTDYIAGLMGVASPPESETPGRRGNIFDGAYLREYVGHLEYPSYRDGYREMVSAP